MSTNRTNLVGALLAVGALGATAGMMAWRWSQRHRAQRMSYHRELSRWEGEGGALDVDGSGVAGAAASGASLSGARASDAAASGQSNGAAGAPWPFPHGNA